MLGTRSGAGGRLHHRAGRDKLHCFFPPVQAMALPHASSGQSLDVRPFADRLASSKTAALLKSEDLEVMRLMLLEGKSLPQHRVPGEITIHCLEGNLDVQFGDATVNLEAGKLLFLAGNVTHGLKAVTDATALITIALRRLTFPA